MTSLLGDVALFAGVDHGELARLEAEVEELRLPANAAVFEVGDGCDGLYQVRRGGVSIRREAVGEPIERVWELGEGELFGEMEVLDRRPRQFAARTLGPAVLLRIPRRHLIDLLTSNPLVEARLRGLIIQRRTSLLPSLLAPASRRVPRIRVGRPARLALPGGAECRVEVEDLSVTGACLSRAPASWIPGQEVELRLGIDTRPELLVASVVVRWRDGDRVGVAFADDSPAFRARVTEALRELVGKAGAHTNQ